MEKFMESSGAGKREAVPLASTKHSIPTNDVGAHRHMADSSSCGFCGSPDSWSHPLLNVRSLDARGRWSMTSWLGGGGNNGGSGGDNDDSFNIMRW